MLESNILGNTVCVSEWRLSSTSKEAAIKKYKFMLNLSAVFALSVTQPIELSSRIITSPLLPGEMQSNNTHFSERL